MKIVLVGNQNSGKSTLFNLLTGLNQKIGNWPGVTIEKKEGTIKETGYTLIDLPGIYSLSPYTLEERIACNFLFEEKPDAIINIIDVNSLERSLYLTTQLLELDIPVIVALNMADIFKKKGGKINAEILGEYLKTEVVIISARRGNGVKDLIAAVNLLKPGKKYHRYSEKLENKIRTIEAFLKCVNRRFIAIKLLEGDMRFENYINDDIRNYLDFRKDEDYEETVATERYRIIEEIKTKALKPPNARRSLSEKIDRVILNKYLAFPIFVLVIFGLYFIVVLLGGLFTDYFENIFFSLRISARDFFTSAGAAPWLVSLTTNGIMSGIGAVLTFIPQIIVLFTIVALLEATGYLSRVSFLLDRLFNRLGLSGRTLIPFIVGFGCSVPGIMATRTIENEQERKSAAILVPFIPCSAKLPIIALFAGFFFENHKALVSTSLFFLSIVLIVISALILKRVFKTKASTYISELPDYRLPDFKYIFHNTWDKTYAFIKRAGSVILIGSIVLWVLLSFSPDIRYGVDIEHSILAVLGNAIAWFFYPIIGTWSWAAGVSAIQGLVAKEQIVASLGVIAGFTGGSPSAGQIFGSSIFTFFTWPSAYAFMAFNLFSAPCVGAIGAMRKELGGTRKALMAALFQTGIAWVTSVLLFAVLSLFASII